MSHFRAVLTFAVIGTLLGIVVSTLTSPSLVSSEMCGFGGNVKLSSPCIETVNAATSSLVRNQLYGGLGGTVLGIAAGIFFTVRRAKKASASTVDAAVVPPKA